jgi:putative hydroxymethylpyrimidine transport system substrate-binding protein
MLDFYANPNHVPLYAAAAEQRFEARGLDVEILVPSNPSDPLKLAAVGTIDIALTPQINYLIARDERLPLVAIGALIDAPLGGLLALSEQGIESLSDLVGARIGYSLAPLEPVLWTTMFECAGLDSAEVELIHVGFNTVSSLLTGAVDAIGAFRNYEPILIEIQGATPVFFPQEDHCIPETYDIILVCRPVLVEQRGDDLRAFLDAMAEAIDGLRADPEAAYRRFVEAHPELDDALSRRSYERTVPLYAEGMRHDDASVWARLQQFLLDNALIGEAWPMDSLYTAELLAAPQDADGGS